MKKSWDYFSLQDDKNSKHKEHDVIDIDERVEQNRKNAKHIKETSESSKKSIEVRIKELDSKPDLSECRRKVLEVKFISITAQITKVFIFYI